jgi:molybdenum cofactor cytidylyltransferase
MPQLEFTAILLAAGYSRRFGSAKLLQPLKHDIPLGLQAALNLRAAQIPVFVVVNPEQTALMACYQQYQFPMLPNLHAQQGIGTSIAAGVKATPSANGWLIALADMPFIQPQTLKTIWQALVTGAALVAPSYQGQRGHPVGFSAAFQQDLLALNQDTGAQCLLQQQQAHLQLIPTHDAGVVRDIDLPSDLAMWQAQPYQQASPYSEVISEVIF